MTTDEIYDAAYEAYEQEDFTEAFRLFTEASQRGHYDAQNYLGTMYYSGRGVGRDKDKALYWYKRSCRTATQQGKYALFSNVAHSYAEMGQRRRAFYWWKKCMVQYNGRDGEAALSMAKFLLAENKGKPTQRVIELLKLALDCEAWEEISLAGWEDAEALLAKLEKSKSTQRQKSKLQKARTFTESE